MLSKLRNSLKNENGGTMLKFFTGEDGTQLIVGYKDKEIESISSCEYCIVLEPKGTWTKFKVNKENANE